LGYAADQLDSGHNSNRWYGQHSHSGIDCHRGSLSLRRLAHSDTNALTNRDTDTKSYRYANAYSHACPDGNANSFS
jgi:hypothetical protein